MSLTDRVPEEIKDQPLIVGLSLIFATRTALAEVVPGPWPLIIAMITVGPIIWRRVTPTRNVLAVSEGDAGDHEDN